MMGSSLLALPWGFSQSGLTVGAVTVFVIGILSFYSCYLIVKNSKGYEDLMDVAAIHLGKPGVLLCFISSTLVLVGGIIAFDILMSDSLYDHLVFFILRFV
jgi:solute carrier family 38 (sodium-coupled neutral amino acid transporter), member 9